MDIKMPIDISCQEMLSNHCTYCGWLRKEAVIRKLFSLSWRKTYCVLFDKCFYYFKNETSKKPTGKFPLYGFNKVKRNMDDNVKWSFVLEHIQPNQKSYIFAASSQQEMVEWMKYIKEEMLRANNQGPRTTADGSSDGNDGLIKQYSLDKIEEKIYDDLEHFQPVRFPDTNSNDSDLDSDIEMDKEKDFDESMQNIPSPQSRIPELPIANKSKRNVFMAGKVPLKPKLPQRSPGEGQPNPRRLGYEHVDIIADRPDSIPLIPKQSKQLDFWDSIYYYGDKDEATKIIEGIAEDGVYLVRDSDEASKVLLVYSKNHNRAKKFKILMQNKDSNPMYYMQTWLMFETIEELIYHYHHNSICNDEIFKLTTPYLLAKNK